MLVSEFVQSSLRGDVTIEAVGLDGQTTDLVVIRNKITTVGLNMLRDILEGIIADGEIKYTAWGSSNLAVSAAHVALDAEEGRKAITSKAAGAAVIVTATQYVAPSEWTAVQIEELGWFAGLGATAAADSGIMIGRILYSRAKTTIESLNIVRTDTITET